MSPRSSCSRGRGSKPYLDGAVAGPCDQPPAAGVHRHAGEGLPSVGPVDGEAGPARGRLPHGQRGVTAPGRHLPQPGVVQGGSDGRGPASVSHLTPRPLSSRRRRAVSSAPGQSQQSQVIFASHQQTGRALGRKRRLHQQEGEAALLRGAARLEARERQAHCSQAAVGGDGPYLQLLWKGNSRSF